jgi:hypothetical protein
MNEHAVPVLIAFLTVAGVAALLLRRAFAALNRQQIKNEAGSLRASPIGGPDLSRAETRSEP